MTSASRSDLRRRRGAALAPPSPRRGGWTATKLTRDPHSLLARLSCRSFQRGHLHAIISDGDEVAVGDLLPVLIVVEWFAGEHHAVVALQREQGVPPCGGAQLGTVARQDVQPCVRIG